MNFTNEQMTDNRPAYQKPVVFGRKKSEITPMAGNRFMMGAACCICSGHGMSRA